MANPTTLFTNLADSIVDSVGEALSFDVSMPAEFDTTLLNPQVLGRSEPPSNKGDVFRIEREPTPDIFSGDGHNDPGSDPLCLGELLELRFTLAPLYNRDDNGDVSIKEDDLLRIRQGFIGNCPLIACMAAMVHVPHYRRQLASMITIELRQVSSFREPEVYESCPSGAPPPKHVQLGSSELYKVTFKRAMTPSAHVERPAFLGQVVKQATVRVSGALYINTMFYPEQIHYAHMVDDSGSQVLHSEPIWPAIIEKAYAVARGNNSYEGLDNFVTKAALAAFESCLNAGSGPCQLVTGFDPLDVLRDMAGSAKSWSLSSLTDSKLMKILRRHDTRPTIVDTSDSLPDGSIPPGDHSLAVIGTSGEQKSDFKVKLFNAIDGTTLESSIDALRDIVANVFQTVS